MYDRLRSLFDQSFDIDLIGLHYKYARYLMNIYTKLGRKSAFLEFLLQIPKILFFMQKKKCLQKKKILGLFLSLTNFVQRLFFFMP